MKCRNCNGDLVFENSIWKCTSCGSQFSVTEYCGDVDVFICYIESDENGRRTRDSLVAQEIYNLLEQNKIKSFYKRISLETVTGDIAEITEESAINVAKIILVLGTSKSTFDNLLVRYGKKISSKKIIPVYLGMDAKDIPNEINAIQALKYDQVGASSDLITVIARLLGKQIEIENNYESLSSKEQRKKLILVITIATIMFIVILAGSIVAWNIISKKLISKTEDSSSTTMNATEDFDDNADASTKDEETLYSSAVEHMDNGEYADAIEELSELGSYNDSPSLLKTCYAKYSGYYYDKDNGVYLQLQHYEDNGSVEIYAFNKNGEKCTVNETIQYKGCLSSFDYNDSENNHGTGNIELSNSSVKISLKSTELNSDVFLPDFTIDFALAEKADQPISEGITPEFLKEILSNKTTIGDLYRRGYELSYLNDLESDNYQNLYQIVNTEVQVVASGYEQDRLYDYDYGIVDPPEHDTPDYKDEKDYTIVGIQAPASVVIPDKVGERDYPIVDADVLYCPNCMLWCPGFVIEFFEATPTYFDERSEIEGNTVVSMCSKSSVGAKQFERMAESWGKNAKDDTTKNSYKQPEAGQYTVLLMPSNGNSQTYVKKCDFDNDTMIIEGTFYRPTDVEWYEGFDFKNGEYVYDTSLGIKLTSNSVFFGYDKNNNSSSMTKDQFKKKVLNSLSSGLMMDFQVSMEGEGFEFSLYPDPYGKSSGGDYILPDSADRLLTEADLVGLSTDELRKARNEIVARRGRLFKDAELQEYFNSKSWYTGAIAPDDFDNQVMLSDIERSNMDFIKQHE